MILLIFIFVVYLFLFLGISTLVAQRLSIWDGVWAGIVIVGLLAYVLSFFHGIGGGLLFFCLLGISIIFLFSKLPLFLADLKVLKPHFLLLLLWTALVAAHAALPSNYLDDGIYYSQSVGWFENYGLVKGLGNVDPNLSQGSLLHALSAITNFSFLDFRLNDFAAFSLWLVGLEIIQKRNSFKISLLFAFSLGLLFSLWMISAENTDVFLVVIFLKIFLLFYSAEKLYSKKLLLGLISLAIGVKISALPLVLLLLSPYFRPWSLASRMFLAALLPLSLVFFKSWYLTGYPLFPFHSWQPFEVAWSIPSQFFYFSKVSAFFSAFIISTSEFSDFGSVSILERIILLFYPMDWRSISPLLFLMMTIYSIFKFFRRSDLLFFLFPIYTFSLIYIFSSPQPRIALPYVFFLLWIIITQSDTAFSIQPKFRSFVKNLSFIIPYSIAVVMLFLPWHYLEAWFRSDGITSYRTLAMDYVLTPHPTWQNIPVQENQINHINFYQPIQADVFCYDAAFPCLVMPVQDYLDDNFYFAPRLLGDSFRSGIAYEKWPIDSIPLEKWNSFSHRLRDLGINSNLGH